MSSKKSLPALAAIILATSAAAYSQPATDTQQENKPSVQEGRREGRRRHGKMGGLGSMRLMRELDLTEAQREQQQAIVQRYVGNTRAQREELFKLRQKRIAGTFAAEDETRARVLRDEIHSSMENIRSEMQSVLTAEQRVRLEQLESARKARHEQTRERRRERRETIPR